jgi:hypothetical protein
MTVVWLIVWLFAHTPAVEAFGPWNNWGTALVVCLAIDLITSLGSGKRTRAGASR